MRRDHFPFSVLQDKGVGKNYSGSKGLTFVRSGLRGRTDYGRLVECPGHYVRRSLPLPHGHGSVKPRAHDHLQAARL